MRSATSPSVHRRRRAVLLAVLAGTGLIVSIALSAAGRRPHPPHPAVKVALRAPAVEPAKPARTVARHRHRRGVAAGYLPQTHVLPSSSDSGFAHVTRELWDGVVHNSLDTALPAFFPRAAYVQVKAIGAPTLDWSGRLVHDYRLDVAAAHSLLGGRPTTARLLRVLAPASNAHWVPPGACYNRVGYYELPSSRVVYRVDGQTRSFGIASLISWRGAWYVVHLGAIVRSGGSGIVDEPHAGTGSPMPSTAC